MKKQMEKQSWRPLLKKVLGPNVPWLWFLATIAAGMLISNIGVRTSELSGQIMGGEIFDSGLLLEYVLLTTLSLVASNAVTVSRVTSCYCAERNIQRSLWKKLIHMPMRAYDLLP